MEDQYVFWYEDLWGWDSSPGASTADFLREQEVGTKAMVFERWETTNPGLWFSALAHEIEVRGVRH